MNECGFLEHGRVGDAHVWVDNTTSIPAFDPTATYWLPVTPVFAPDYKVSLTRSMITTHAQQIVFSLRTHIRATPC